jgi:hypothetical protein
MVSIPEGSSFTVLPPFHAHVEPERACVFPKWSKMAIIPFCTFLPVLKKTVAQRNQEQIGSPKPSLNHGRRIKTILGQFRNRHARYKTEISNAVHAFCFE